ncbi:hypothetical protein NOR_06723 [Metarhizium rileyi]|uniref:Single-strand DNA deaminase toxin A-like C-terminal domain-containing protein n=1 Tax=Metarhizium rileyi (strain RCEF 4871) TaxID=1649241 RepID=A0A166ZX85_METRR|nr:hypothetical protein NOR_06723 [Metarhizium rileyi RCEF 4871]
MDTQHAPDKSTETAPRIEFDSEFASQDPILYFYHIIDPEKATLQTQVLGPNVSNTFRHPRALTECSPSHVQNTLVRKTTGFLALSQPGAPARTILAWAESGHGHNPRGDFLDPSASVLSNKRWTSRVLRLAREMDINMGHPYDRLARGGKTGIFRASHVEVKLAVHAVYTLLKMANVPTSRVTRGDLAQLHGKAWRHGSKPMFEIYFSKKNCLPCAKYVRRLEELTGVDIKLCWRDRLVKIEYGKCTMGVVQVPVSQREVISVDAADEEGNDIALVDLTDEMDDVAEVTPEPLGAYVDGLAYCIGQMGGGRRAIRAVVELARIWKRQAARRGQRHLRDGVGQSQRLTPPVSGRTTWLTTPPPPPLIRQRREHDTSRTEEVESGRVGNAGDRMAKRRSPRQYSFVGGEMMSLARR